MGVSFGAALMFGLAFSLIPEIAEANMSIPRFQTGVCYNMDTGVLAPNCDTPDKTGPCDMEVTCP